MQGRFFRVDGADLETGEETYLVLQAVSIDEAESVARRQGMLISTVRAASESDWGAGSKRKVATAEGEAPANASAVQFETDHGTRVPHVPTPLESRLYDDSPDGSPSDAKPVTERKSVFGDAPVNVGQRMRMVPPQSHSIIAPTARDDGPEATTDQSIISPESPSSPTALPIGHSASSSSGAKPAASTGPAPLQPSLMTPTKKVTPVSTGKIPTHPGINRPVAIPKPPTPTAKPVTPVTPPTTPRPTAIPLKGLASGGMQIRRIAPPAPARQVRLTPATPPRRIPPTIPAANAPPPIAPPETAPVQSPIQQPQIVDMAPAAPESQRVSGDVMGGSGIDQIATEIDWEEGAEAVEHSAGSALEQLAWKSTASYPAQGDATAEPATQIMAPETEIPVARVVALPSSVAQTPAVHRPSPRGSGVSPIVAYFLSPIATLVTLGGLYFAIMSQLNPAPADATDVARLEQHLQDATRLFTGGMLFMAGLVIFVVAAFVQTIRVMNSRK